MSLPPACWDVKVFWRVGEGLRSKRNKDLGSRGPGCLPCTPRLLSLALQAQRSRGLEASRHRWSRDRDQSGQQAGCWGTNGQMGLSRQGTWRHGPASQSLERWRLAQKWVLRAGDVDSKTGLDVHLNPSHTPPRRSVCARTCVCLWRLRFCAWLFRAAECVPVSHSSVSERSSHTGRACLRVQASVRTCTCAAEAVGVCLGWACRVSLGGPTCLHLRIGGMSPAC